MSQLTHIIVRIVTLTDEIKRLHAAHAELGKRQEELTRIVAEHDVMFNGYQQTIERQDRLIEQYGKRIDDFERRLDEAVELRVMREMARRGRDGDAASGEG